MITFCQYPIKSEREQGHHCRRSRVKSWGYFRFQIKGVSVNLGELSIKPVVDCPQIEAFETDNIITLMSPLAESAVFSFVP